MPASKASTVSEYLENLPADRKKALSAVRKVIRKHLPDGIRETLNWGMICYEVPLKTFAATYNGKPLMYAALASQKSHMSLYLMCLYADGRLEKKLRANHANEGKKLDLGKSCLRFKKLEDVSLEAIGGIIGALTLPEFIALHEKAHRTRGKKR